MGFTQDIYKLSFLSHREKDDLISALNMVPGHKDRMNELFSIIE